MSMSFSEFKKLMGADPLNKEAETLLARASAPEFEQCAAEAEAFEYKLGKAFDVREPVDGFVDEIISLSKHNSSSLNWFAIAASVLIMVGVAGVTWQQTRPTGNIEIYVADHYAADGQALMALASEDFDVEVAKKIMASFNMTADQELTERIRFTKLCPTMNGEGAHLIVKTDQGLINVIYMPKTAVKDRRIIEFGGMQAYLVALEVGSVAIIGRLDQEVSSLDSLVRESLSHSI